jgi:hypothetical protein
VDTAPQSITIAIPTRTAILSMTRLANKIPLRLSLSKPFHRLFTLRLFDRLTAQGERPICQNENCCNQNDFYTLGALGECVIVKQIGGT